mmetsp:Transcript_46084/g.73165  ORF Transcript_46084/g.73165 Transcript_46084/m.73165 type:complete len:180 (-) Transcript_46084:85-624(-)
MGQVCGSAALPGGLKEKDTVFYAGPEQLLEGYMLKYGAEGKVVGPSRVADGRDPERVLVKFPDTESPVACFFTSLQTQAPPMELKEGWHVGETVVYLGDDREAGGKRLCAGMPCKVVGPGAEASSVAVQFPGLGEPILTANVGRPSELPDCAAACWLEACGTPLRIQPQKVLAKSKPSK